MRAMRFSKPVSSACESGRLSGSAQTRSLRSAAKAGSAEAAAIAIASATRTSRGSGQRENIQGAALLRVQRQVAHRVDEAERRRPVAWVDRPADDGAGPAADSGEDGDVLLAVGAAVAD